MCTALDASGPVVLELPYRWEPASKVLVDLDYCGAWGQSVNGSGRGVGGPAARGFVGSIVRLVPGVGDRDSKEASTS